MRKDQVRPVNLFQQHLEKMQALLLYCKLSQIKRIHKYNGMKVNQMIYL